MRKFAIVIAILMISHSINGKVQVKIYSSGECGDTYQERVTTILESAPSTVNKMTLNLHFWLNSTCMYSNLSTI